MLTGNLMYKGKGSKDKQQLKIHLKILFWRLALMLSDSAQPSMSVLMLNCKNLQLVCQQWLENHYPSAPSSSLLCPSQREASSAAFPILHTAVFHSFLDTASAVMAVHVDCVGNPLHPTTFAAHVLCTLE